MSSELAIRVEGIGKSYRIGSRQAGYRTFREAIVDALATPFRRAAGLLRGQSSAAADLDRTIWALRDVSVDVCRGEVIGIIGANGAGKSTLLKILSRITEPTTGWAEIRGRVGSLLEVGTGFHSELTGRENIFLSGAILGMQKNEIERKFDEIAAFAGVEKFLDTPVKHFSSGMHVRLAFSVAAHLETEILLVDEVLAVGDAAFRRKCLRRMGDVAHQGRTILFVSHNMASIQSLCGRVLVLSGGEVLFDGASEEGISYYLRANQNISSSIDLAPYRSLSRTSRRFFERLAVRDLAGTPCSVFAIGESVVFDFVLSSSEVISDPQIEVAISNILGTRIFTIKPRWLNQSLGSLRGRQIARCVLKNLKLAPGRYTLMAQFGSYYKTFEIVDSIPVFEISPSDYWGSGQLPTPISHGVVIQDAEWSWVDPIPEVPVMKD